MNNTTSTQPAQATVQPKKPERRPNETGAITVTGHVRIFDPQTQQTYVEKQG